MTIDLRQAILDHRAVIEAAGEVMVADDLSRERAALKRAADEALWTLAEAAEQTNIRGLRVMDEPATQPHHIGPTVPGSTLMDVER